MSDLIESGDVMKQIAVSRHSGAGSLIFSNISEDDPRFIKGTSPVFITAIIEGFHIEYPVVSEESGEGRRPYVLVNAQIESISGVMGGYNRTLAFADYDAQKFSFYYPISDEELMNMVSDGLYRYKTFADTLALQMKDEFREVTFSCDLDYTLFFKTAGDIDSKQILICDPVSIFHDRSFLEPSMDFIPPGIQDNEKIYGLSFRLDDASKQTGEICADTDQEERSVRNINEVKIRDLDDGLLNSILSSEQIEALLNEAEEDEDDFVPDAALWEDEEEEKPELRADDPLFDFEPMAEGADSFAPYLLEEDEPEEDVPEVPGLEDREPEKSDTIVVDKNNELTDSVKMVEDTKEAERVRIEQEAEDLVKAEAEKAEEANAEIDALFADMDDAEELVLTDVSETSDESEKKSEGPFIIAPVEVDTDAIAERDVEKDTEDLQQKVDDAGLHSDDEDEDEDALFMN